jgi:UDP:flavonoid glycosyltransferase YjiC (YdhE family)
VSHYLLAWELGGALGHLAALRALATPLLARGHRITLALSDLSRVEEFFAGLTAVPAPITKQRADAIAQPSTFADILSIAGWNDTATLRQLCGDWRKLFARYRPDVVIGSFAPTALLAAQGLDCRSVVFGTGFYSPPDISPLPDLCPWRNNYPDRLLITEQCVLESANSQLREQRARPLEQVTQLYQRADANLMTTYLEMDHYSDRIGGNYVGPWGELPGERPEWPAGVGPRVFAYLKPMEAFVYLLDFLKRAGWPTLVYAPEAEQTAASFGCDTLQIAVRPLDIRDVTATCSFAILNAGHNATLQFLLAGKPILALPLSGEQQLVTRNVERLNAGLGVGHDSPTAAVARLDRIVNDPQYGDGARRFAIRYAQVDRAAQIATVMEWLERIARS